MTPIRTVTFALLILADLALVLLLPFAVPVQTLPVPQVRITAPAHSLAPRTGLPPAEVDCDGGELRTPWCEARYTNVI